MSDDPAPLVTLSRVDFSYAGHRIYRDLTLSVPRGRITAVLGPSGTGKTTLLRLIGAQLRPDRGQVRFDGTDVHRLSRRRLFTLRQRMSMLFQSGALFQDMTVFDNVAFPLREHTALPEELIRDLVLMKLECVGMRQAAGLYPAELSGGMSRRAALARAIALDPDFIMYDEPFVGQDPVTKGILVRLITDLNRALGLTSLVVTHDVREILAVADFVYILADGNVLGAGTPGKIEASADPRVRQFISGEARALPAGPVAADGGRAYFDEL